MKTLAIIALLLLSGCAVDPSDVAPLLSGPPHGGSPAMTCGECRAQACGRQEEACSSAEDCRVLESCIASCGQDAPCSSECVRTLPSWHEGQALRQCVADSCADECPGWR